MLMMRIMCIAWAGEVPGLDLKNGRGLLCLRVPPFTPEAATIFQNGHPQKVPFVIWDCLPSSFASSAGVHEEHVLESKVLNEREPFQ